MKKVTIQLTVYSLADEAYSIKIIGVMSSVSAFAAGCLPNVTSKLSDVAKFYGIKKCSIK